MTVDEAGNVILEIFRKECDKPKDWMSNKIVHDLYFRKTESGLGFTEALHWLVKKGWLAEKEGEVNCHEITKRGWTVDI